MVDASDRQVRVSRESGLIEVEQGRDGTVTFWSPHVWDWLCENKMVTSKYPTRKWNRLPISGEETPHVLVTFKTPAHAVAFKLRWLDDL